MPIYDYTCSSCGHRTEVIHGINDPAPRFCPSCGAEGRLRKAFSTPAILFKGSGWAKKDRAATRSSSSSGSADKTGDRSNEKATEKGSEGSKAGDSKAGDSSTESKTTGSSKSSSSTSSSSSKAAD